MRWDEYDQRDVIPKALMSSYSNLTFSMKGHCSLYTDVHGYEIHYRPTNAKSPNRTEFGSVDVAGLSCLSGWTCGNVVAPASVIASFFYDLLGPEPRLVSKASLAEMTKFHDFKWGWDKWMSYGLGLMKGSYARKTLPPGSDLLDTIGHGGSTYGFVANNGYNPALQFAWALVSNNESLVDGVFNAHFYGPTGAECPVYNALLLAIGNGSLPSMNCSLGGPDFEK